MNEDEIKTALTGKRILFVEDRPDTILFYEKRLEDIPDVETEQAESQKEAWDLFYPVREPPPFDIVLIDLNLPPVPSELLKGDARKLEPRDLNEGQALGLWLSKHYPKVPYAYLTALPGVIDRSVHKSQEKIAVLDKNLVSAYDFPGKIYGICRSWEDRQELKPL
ncbi:MAG: response regulator [Gammaproteobacteria bacterium]|nr:response regulator [Gammaproteobacteria bacterium]